MTPFHFGDPVAPAFHFVDPAAPAFHFGDPVPVGIPVAAVGDPVAVGIPVDAVGGPVAAPQAQDVGIPVAAVADPVPPALNHWFPDSNDITLRYCAPDTPIAHLVEFFKQQHLISGQKHWTGLRIDVGIYTFDLQLYLGVSRVWDEDWGLPRVKHGTVGCNRTSLAAGGGIGYIMKRA